eukprot:CAMPEP_0170472286 /NCGR_PEP_ID=MMETSP0123-20130129/14344_1 /TAXON_ID=182087 /ORGANISM="Favella ehrenbergii, Strain Fehren 1" /LENGTH=338 /DNA_ID=CAMNT_0010740459 /DNA_START=580 /DNA_END=1598 /DNA_ORIENTATION=-
MTLLLASSVITFSIVAWWMAPTVNVLSPETPPAPPVAALREWACDEKVEFFDSNDGDGGADLEQIVFVGANGLICFFLDSFGAFLGIVGGEILRFLVCLVGLLSEEILRLRNVALVQHAEKHGRILQAQLVGIAEHFALDAHVVEDLAHGAGHLKSLCSIHSAEIFESDEGRQHAQSCGLARDILRDNHGLHLLAQLVLRRGALGQMVGENCASHSSKEGHFYSIFVQLLDLGADNEARLERMRRDRGQVSLDFLKTFLCLSIFLFIGSGLKKRASDELRCFALNDDMDERALGNLSLSRVSALLPGLLVKLDESARLVLQAKIDHVAFRFDSLDRAL